MIPIPSLRTIVLIIGALLAGGVILQTHRLHAAQDNLVELHDEFSTFKGGVAALGEAAIRQKAITEATNERNKERADEENRKRTAAVAATIRSLRAAADDARRRFLSQTPAGSKCPDGQACFDRADFERAYGELVDEVRTLADEGTAVTIDLNTAKGWVNVRP